MEVPETTLRSHPNLMRPSEISMRGEVIGKGEGKDAKEEERDELNVYPELCYSLLHPFLAPYKPTSLEIMFQPTQTHQMLDSQIC